MTADVHYPPGLSELVAGLTYKPGWEFRLEVRFDPDGAGGLTFGVISCTEHSRNAGQMIHVYHPFLVPPASYNRRCWVAWIRDRIADVENHELGEFLLVDGVREFGPHHGNGENPYIVWHVGDLEDTAIRAGDTKPSR
jgi:hypothetical protein